MKVLIAGGRGFIGSALRRDLISAGHEVWLLTRRSDPGTNELHWDGRTPLGWSHVLNDMDAVVNTTGYGLEHWPWTSAQKTRFLQSRVVPGNALASAIAGAKHRPRVFVQLSGINHYGSRGATVADEATPAGTDFLAQLTIAWEAATSSLEGLGVRRVVARNAVVLAARGGLFPLMALPVRLFAGGPLGDGKQVVPWIHLVDLTSGLRFLLETDRASGIFNLIAPSITSNEEFMRATAAALHRPYWLRMPAFLFRAALGEMSVLVVDGRPSKPKRLLDMGFQFRYPTIEVALQSIVRDDGALAAPTAHQDSHRGHPQT